MDDATTLELTPAEIKRLIDALHTTLETENSGDGGTSDADKVLLMKLVEALR